MKLKVYSPDGSKAKEKEISQFPVLEGDRGVQALRQLILAYEANARQGNASTKTRAEVSGTGKKPHRQKGTGMARHGSRRSPIWRKGGVAFGPKPRDYSQSVNKKVRKLAFQRALFDCAARGSLALIEKCEMPEAKTRHFDALLKKVAPEGKVLFVDDSFSEDTALSSRNIPRLTLNSSASLSARELVSSRNVILSEKALDTLLARLGEGSSE